MMNKVFEIVEAKKIFNFKYSQLEILIHPQSYLHAIVKFNNGLTKLLVHDTEMVIPIFNSLYHQENYKIKSNYLNFKILNNLDLKRADVKRYPLIKILNNITNKDSLFDTVITRWTYTIAASNIFLVHLLTWGGIAAHVESV